LLGNIKIGRCCCWEILRSPDAAGKYQDRARLLLGNIEIEQCGRTMLSGKERALPGQRETPSTKHQVRKQQAPPPKHQAAKHQATRSHAPMENINGKDQAKHHRLKARKISTENINGKDQAPSHTEPSPQCASTIALKHHAVSQAPS